MVYVEKKRRKTTIFAYCLFNEQIAFRHLAAEALSQLVEQRHCVLRELVTLPRACVRYEHPTFAVGIAQNDGRCAHERAGAYPRTVARREVPA